jgi:hypothetical protein
MKKHYLLIIKQLEEIEMCVINMGRDVNSFVLHLHKVRDHQGHNMENVSVH